MKQTHLVATAVAASMMLAAGVSAYDNPFTLDFSDSATASNFSDPEYGSDGNGTTIETGETSSVDSPAYSNPPESATGSSNIGGGWLRVGRTDTSIAGLSLAVYDGTAGGSTSTSPADYTVEGDVYIITDGTSNRLQTGIFGRYGASSTPFEVFYSQNVGSQPEGYGYRGGGSTSSYGISELPVETENRWVHMRITFSGSEAEIGIDRDMDGTEDYTESGISLTDTDGSIGAFTVFNDPDDSFAGLPDQFGYYDNLQFTPTTSVDDWTLY